MIVVTGHVKPTMDHVMPIDERNCSEPMREILDQSEDESILIIKIISIKGRVRQHFMISLDFLLKTLPLILKFK